MGMGANYHGYPPIQKMAQRHFFRSRLAMHIHQNEISLLAQPHLVQQLVKHLKGIIILRHKQIGLDIDNAETQPARPLNNHPATAGKASPHIGRAQQPRLVGYIGGYFCLVPDMIAAGQHICPGRQQIICNRRGDPETTRAILAIYDNKIGCKLLAQIRQLCDHRLTRSASDNIAQK